MASAIRGSRVGAGPMGEAERGRRRRAVWLEGRRHGWAADRLLEVLLPLGELRDARRETTSMLSGIGQNGANGSANGVNGGAFGGGGVGGGTETGRPRRPPPAAVNRPPPASARSGGAGPRTSSGRS